MEQFRPNLKFSDELIDIVVAVLALSIGFALALSGGFTGLGSFIYIFPVALIAIILSFPLHEYMHKVVAQKFGAIAAFRRSDTGIIITLATGFMGFLFGMPGATMIYTNNFTNRENGIVSVAGPLTNFAIFAILRVSTLLLGIALPSVDQLSLTLPYVVSFVLFINLWLAFFNMLPIYPLDGSKVLRWNKPVYTGVMLLVVAMLALINPTAGLVYSMVIAFIFAIVVSFLSRGLVFRQ